MASEKKRIAVIGAGPAGLCTLKHLSQSSEDYEIVAFERNFWPGGLWVYTDMTGNDEYGVPIHSAMYKKLKLVCNHEYFYIYLRLALHMIMVYIELYCQ